MAYDRKNYGGIEGYDQRTPRITSQQYQDDPSLEYKVNSTNQLLKKTYYPNSEPVEGFAIEDSYAVPIEDLGSIYNLHQLVIQFSMMLAANTEEAPKFVQAVRVLHTKDRMSTSLDELNLKEENKQKKIAESVYTLCFFWDATLSTIGKIPKNSLVQLYFIDNKKEYGIIWSSSFLQLGNFSGVPNPAFDKFNGTTLTNFGSPGSGTGFAAGNYTNGSADHGKCNPHPVAIVPDNFIFCGTQSDKERKITVHPGAPVLNYANPAFEANGYKRLGGEREYINPKIMVTHWDVTHNSKSMFDAIQARNVKMGFGVDRDGLIIQLANAGQAKFGALGFNEGTVQCEVCNPVEPKDHVHSYNMRCFGNEDGGRRRIPNTPKFTFPGEGAVLSYEYIYDFLDPQYFSIGALWEACSFAYNIPLVIPDKSWIDWRPGGASPSHPHPYKNDTDPQAVRRNIANSYSGILFHHNVDIRENGKSGKIDIVLLDRERILKTALQCRNDRNANKF